MIVLGNISAVYGVKGWVKVYSHAVNRCSIFDYQPWHLSAPAKTNLNAPIAFPVEIAVDDWRQQGKYLLAHLSGVDQREVALHYVGCEIRVPELKALEEGDYYWHQLQNLKVQSHYRGRVYDLGRVAYMIETGANDVLVVEPTEDSIDERQRLIPWVPELTIKRVVLDDTLIEVNWDIDF